MRSTAAVSRPQRARVVCAAQPPSSDRGKSANHCNEGGVRCTTPVNRPRQDDRPWEVNGPRLVNRPRLCINRPRPRPTIPHATGMLQETRLMMMRLATVPASKYSQRRSPASRPELLTLVFGLVAYRSKPAALVHTKGAVAQSADPRRPRVRHERATEKT